jgi:predicted HTH transcriptional regulator
VIRWSRLHAALGVGPRELTIDLFRRAVAEGVTEDDDLDWKEPLPGREPANADEFAKDVAAMANTRGGLLVYGVKEERGTGRAVDLPGVDVSEPVRRRLRMLAASRIHPMVGSLDPIPVEDEQTPGRGVLALWVPQSADAPVASTLRCK